MKCKNLIGITGFAGSGKGAAAGILGDMGFERMKFAGPLKAALEAILTETGMSADMTERMIEGDLKEVSRVELGGYSPREFMQWLGTGARDRFGEDIWVNMMIHKILKSESQSIVIDDVRFVNEAAAIRGFGGVVVEMHRGGVGPINGHVSERIVEGDAMCRNDGGIDDLQDDMEELATWVLSRQRKISGAAA